MLSLVPAKQLTEIGLQARGKRTLALAPWRGRLALVSSEHDRDGRATQGQDALATQRLTRLPAVRLK